MGGNTIRIAVVQFEPVFLDVDATMKKALDVIDGASADVYLFPELFLSGYTFKDADEVRRVALDPSEGGALSPLFAISRDRSIGISGGYVERDKTGFFNSSFFIGDGKLVSNYRKLHLFYHEKDFFIPGDSHLSPFTYRGTSFGMMICFDWIFPEVARTLALRGAQVILHPANLVLPYCQRAMYARAIENRVFIVTANRIGEEINGDFKNRFTGGSQVVAPSGEYLLEMTADTEYVGTATIDPLLALDKNITPKNHLFLDRRKEYYE
jgi:predicted amidohydrolase